MFKSLPVHLLLWLALLLRRPFNSLFPGQLGKPAPDR